MIFCIVRGGGGGGVISETLLPALYEFLKQSDMMAYLVMMSSRLIELKRVLKETGSIYLHCDPTASHYLKIVMDGIFGAKNFKNEIIWRRTGNHNKTKRFSPIHDVLLYYTVSKNFVWNYPKRPYMKGHVEENFIKDEKGYKTDYYGNVLTGSGIRNGESGKEWMGVNPTNKKRHWAIPGKCLEGFEEETENMGILEKLDFLYEKGIIKFEQNNYWPIYERYLNPDDGNPVGDIWAFQPYTQGTVFNTDDGIDADVRWLSARDQERLGYPTQKPVGLLERIISASSNEGDIILDPFCGCGTAIHAAQKLNRRWIGIDITHLAVGLIKRRIHAAFPNTKFEIKGTPQDIDAARFLAESNGLDGRYQFQYWALSLIDAIPSNNKKMGADSGIDGFIWFHDSPREGAKPKKMIISVKSGKIPANHIRELRGMLNEQVKIAVLLTLEPPSRKMKADALAAGEYEYENGKKFPKIQILTIQDLLDGKKPEIIDYYEGAAMPKKARREKTEEQVTLF